MARNIYCCKCRAYLGEIREATLAKGIKYMCRGCAAPKPAGDIPDFLKAVQGILGALAANQHE